MQFNLTILSVRIILFILENPKSSNNSNQIWNHPVFCIYLYTISDILFYLDINHFFRSYIENKVKETVYKNDLERMQMKIVNQIAIVCGYCIRNDRKLKTQCNTLNCLPSPVKTGVILYPASILVTIINLFSLQKYLELHQLRLFLNSCLLNLHFLFSFFPKSHQESICLNPFPNN